jgi:hypothetical protein
MKDAQRPDHVSLNTLMQRLKEGRYVIPDFQREFEWGPWDIRDLIRSIFLDYYIGSLLLWKGKKENFTALSCENIYGFTGKANPESIVLDGQQRLTALYYVFTAPEKALPNRTMRAFYYIKIDEFMNEEYDRAFYYEWFSNRWKKNLANVNYLYENHVFPLYIIGAGGWALPTWLQGYSSYWKEKSQKLSSTTDRVAMQKAQTHAENAVQFGDFLRELTEQYQISYIELDKELSVDKICDIFTQINSRGVRLDAFDLINALLKPKGLQLKKLWRDIAPKLEFVDTPRMNVYILQVMSIIRQAYCSPKYLYFLLPGQEKPIRAADGTLSKEVLVPDVHDFERRWNNAVGALENAIKLLKHPQEFGAIKSSYLPYVTILPIFAALQAHAKSLPPAQQLQAQRKIRYWYWASVFTNRYSGSVESTSARDFLDIKAWIESDEASPTLLDEFKSRFRNLDLRSENKRGTSIYNGIFNLLILNGARDWITGHVSQSDDLDDHHIVPSSWGRKHLAGDSINTILNRTPLTAETNRDFIGDRLPNDYLPELLNTNGEEKFRAILQDHFISPAALEILLRKPFTPNDFQDFISERQRTILDAIESLLIKERIRLEPRLRELDAEIEKIELALRLNISMTLDNDPQKLPQPFLKNITASVTKAVRKHATLHASDFQTLQSQMEYFNLMELRDIILDESIWPAFKDLYKNEKILVVKFSQLADLRNGIRHSHTISDITKKEGEASILWFTQVLKEYLALLEGNKTKTSSADINDDDHASDEENDTENKKVERDTTKYDVTAFGVSLTNQAKRNAIFHIVNSLYSHGVRPESITAIIHWRSNDMFFEVNGEKSSEEFIKDATVKQETKGKNFDKGRWFCKSGELIIQHGKTYALSNQWGALWLNAINRLKKEFPEANIECQESKPYLTA